MPTSTESRSGADQPRRVNDSRPLVVHVLYRLDVGGLENGVVNLINRMPAERFRHAVVSLTEVTDFRLRIQRPDVQCIALHKPAGHGLTIYKQLWQVFRELRPAIVHTRNLAALEAQIPAWLARVPVRIHGEHGRDVSDLEGGNRKYRWIRRLFSPWVQRYITVSADLERYLVDGVGVSPKRVTQIYNGVDTHRFHPRTQSTPAMPWPGSTETGDTHPLERQQTGDTHLLKPLILGWVGRMQPVKDPLILVDVLHRLVQEDPARRGWLRLVLIGEGPLREPAMARLRELGMEDLAWLPGSRDDIPELMAAMDIFLLPSLGEGISNTILEALACGLPVIASNVGGNPELVQDGQTGALVPVGDAAALQAAVRRYLDSPETLRQHGAAARRDVEQRFSLEAMVAGYQHLYEQALARVQHGAATPVTGEK